MNVHILIFKDAIALVYGHPHSLVPMPPGMESTKVIHDH